MEKIFTTDPAEFKRKYIKKKDSENKVIVDIENDYFNFIGNIYYI